MAEKLNIARYKMSPGTIWQNDLDIATVYEEEYLHLLAAAPLMLEALETLTAVIGLTPIVANKAAVQEAFNQARAALEAAKGE
jgi:hypothetical protein